MDKCLCLSKLHEPSDPSSAGKELVWGMRRPAFPVTSRLLVPGAIYSDGGVRHPPMVCAWVPAKTSIGFAAWNGPLGKCHVLLSLTTPFPNTLTYSSALCAWDVTLIDYAYQHPQRRLGWEKGKNQMRVCSASSLKRPL